MSKSYEKIAKKIPLATRIEVLEDMAKIDKMEIERLKKELEKVKNLGLADVIERFSDDVIDKLALDKYPESFCWYGNNPPKHIDDNARDRTLWKKGFKAALNAL